MLPRSNLWIVINYPPLMVDDIVPVFGQLHRVTAIHDRGQPKGVDGKDWMMMVKVQERGIPAGVTFQEGSIGLPLSHNGAGGTGFDLGRIRVGVTKIDSAAADNERGPIAEVVVIDNAKLPSETALKLRRGDTLAIREVRYKVLNVIPRDEKTHVIGWIEIDPNPLKEDGAAKKQDPSAVKNPDEAR